MPLMLAKSNMWLVFIRHRLFIIAVHELVGGAISLEMCKKIVEEAMGIEVEKHRKKWGLKSVDTSDWVETMKNRMQNVLHHWRDAKKNKLPWASLKFYKATEKKKIQKKDVADKNAKNKI